MALTKNYISTSKIILLVCSVRLFSEIFDLSKVNRIYLISYDISVINIYSLTFKDFVFMVSASTLTKARWVAEWLECPPCVSKVGGSNPGG